MPPNLTYAVLSQTFLHFTKAEARGLSQTIFLFSVFKVLSTNTKSFALHRIICIAILASDVNFRCYYLNEDIEMKWRWNLYDKLLWTPYCFPQELNSIHCCYLGYICPLYGDFCFLMQVETNKPTKPLASAICTPDKNSWASTKCPVSLSACEAMDKIQI